MQISHVKPGKILIITKPTNEEFDFLQDNNFTELKNAELLKERLEMLSQVENYVGTYFSKEWVKKNVLHLTDDEIGEMQKQMDSEGDDNGEDGDNNFEQKGDGNEPRKNKING